eukprot:CAMPEP_0205814220 /NCGR_PEP_ID=MMETSP0205-20121125/19253_1 /ASSEMBLY_ACC=CAM_ASM_000278 /TAXON_ID=36767 /ORGANISM="Euplotes focardii, Strain TN1" /LENGTH=108 /DNA_ID=CAMNT_0053097839 /DNA_START=429 /DNA_END=755 /DNA_ORIENTATION=-
MNASQGSDDTYHDSISGNLDSSNPMEDAIDSLDQVNFKINEEKAQSKNITPSTSLPEGVAIYENATVVDMTVKEQEKKGLTGLSFKLLKVRNPETQRTKTKFLCTYKT